MKKNREYAFDILRVISMIMVVTVHVSNVYSRSFGIISNKSFLFSLLFNTISRISVPIFFMISGTLLVDREFNKEKYFKRIKKYILLILVWDIIYLVWEYLYLGVTYNNLYKLIVQPYRAHLWFLYSILLLYITQPIMKLVLDKSNRVVKILLLLIWIIFSSLSILNRTIADYFTIFSYIGYFILGKYIYDYIKEHDLRKYNLLFILSIILSISISIFLNYNASLRHNSFYNLFFAYRTPFIIISSISFFILVCSNYRKNSIPKIIELVSELSLGVYLIHGMFLDITVNNFIYSSINSLFGIPIFTTIITISSIIVVYLLRKIKILKAIL